MTVYATLADIDNRYPNELVILASDEETGLVDAGRVAASLSDASLEVRAILRARYGSDELGRLDADSLGVLQVYTIDIALYRVALSFSRSNERIKERYESAIKRLEAIANGKGGLSFLSDGSGSQASDDPAVSSPNEVLIDAPGRVFTRDRLRGV
jgi:phage gp36-like protein